MIVNKDTNITLSRDIYRLDVYQCFSKALKQNLIIFFKNIEKTSLASKKTNQELLSVEIHKLNILSSYLRTIKNTFIKFENNQYDYFDEKIIKINPISQNYNTIDNDELKEKQLQNSLIHKYGKQNISVLSQFKQHLTLLYKQPIDSYRLTLSPFVVISTFAKSIRLLQLTYKNKLILYKFFEKCVLNQLNITYKDISRNYFKQKTQTKNLRKLAKITPDNSIKSTYSTEQIEQAFKIVQRDSSHIDPLLIKKNLLSQLKTNPKQSLSQENMENLNLITLIFQQIQNNKLIALPIKKALSGLQLTYIKYAFSHETLLTHYEHPARLLLKTIIHSSEKWEPSRDENAEFLKQLKTFINVIISHGLHTADYCSQQIKSFNKLTSDCQAFIVPLPPKSNSVEGRNKIITAMKTIDTLLDHKTEEFNTPKYIEKILRTPWKNLLTLLLVRYSNSSNKYLRMINFIDDLFAVLTPNISKTLLENKISTVCLTFEKGLKLIAYQQADINLQSRKLKRFILEYQKKISNKKNTSIDNNEITKVHSSISLFNKSNKPKTETRTVNINNFLKDLNNTDKLLVRPISYGTWVKFKHLNGKTIQAQLSWINPKNGRYLFVNKKGLKITDKSAQQIANGIRENEIILK